MPRFETGEDGPTRYQAGVPTPAQSFTPQLTPGINQIFQLWLRVTPEQQAAVIFLFTRCNGRCPSAATGEKEESFLPPTSIGRKTMIRDFLTVYGAILLGELTILMLRACMSRRSG